MPGSAGPGRRGWRVALIPAVLAVGIAAAALAGRDAKFLRYPEREVARIQNVHRYKGKPVCQACHKYAAFQRVEGDPVALCTRCHADLPAGKHPVGVPAQSHGLPLDAQGRMACHTCHDPHLEGDAPAGLRLEKNELCRACHADK